MGLTRCYKTEVFFKNIYYVITLQFLLQLITLLWNGTQKRFASVSECVRLRALSRSHFLIDFHRNLHRYWQKNELFGTSHCIFPYFVAPKITCFRSNQTTSVVSPGLLALSDALQYHDFITCVLILVIRRPSLVAQAYWCNIQPIFNQYGILRIYWPRYNDCILTSCQYRKVVYSRYLAN